MMRYGRHQEGAGRLPTWEDEDSAEGSDLPGLRCTLVGRRPKPGAWFEGMRCWWLDHGKEGGGADSGFIWKIKLVGFADGLDEDYEGTKMGQ